MSDDIFPIPSFPNYTPHVNGIKQYNDLYRKSIDHPEEFWSEEGKKHIDWMVEPRSVSYGDSTSSSVVWFPGGQLNVSQLCVDRHAIANPEKTAIIWETDEPGEHQYISYGKLLAEVCKTANLFESWGLKKGDRVAIYLPMIPEVIYSMLACARLGLVHCLVFAGFSSEALRDRIVDSRSKIVITADQGFRGSKRTHLKRTVDDAVVECPTVEKVLVVQRTGFEGLAMRSGRDFWWHEEVEVMRPYIDPVPMEAEAPLFILYTSGSTGKPKGLIHTTAGYILQGAMSLKYIFDVHPNDVFASFADVGWITGHTYTTYAPLALGVTTLLFESIPTYPDAGRFWRTVETHKITQVYTAPTAIRILKNFGDQFVTKYDLSTLRVLGSVGEPISPEAWKWYHAVPGRGKCAIVDTYWQTETGSIMMTTLPGANATKPGSCGVPFFGVVPVLVDAQSGKEIEVVKGEEATGVLSFKVGKAAWPALARTVLGNHTRYNETYFKPYPGYFFTGDSARQDKDGYFFIGGRVDDVINVSGHRISTSEVEAALVQHQSIAESAGVGIPDETTGQACVVFVVLKDGNQQGVHHPGVRPPTADEMKRAVIEHVRTALGPFAAPKKAYVVPDLPKTRSGKIMRRILRKVAAGDVKTTSEEDMKELGDLSTLADPALVPELIRIVHPTTAKL